MSTTTNKQGASSAWSRPLNNSSSRGRFGGVGGSSSNRAPPGMEGRDTASSSNANSRSNSWRDRGGRSSNSQSQSQTPSSNNGNNRSSKSSASSANTASSTPALAESREQNERNVLRERFLHLCISMIGQTVTLTQTNGLVLEGIFHTFAPFENQPADIKNIYVIQACRMIAPPTTDDVVVESKNVTFENGATVLVPASKVASVHIKNMRLDAANAAERAVGSANSEDMFQTDSQISGGKGGSDSLVAAGSEWTSAPGVGVGGDALERPGGSGGAPSSSRNNPSKGSDSMNWRSKKSPASGGVSGNMDESIGDWDQFAANREKFGVNTSFDENLYTTKIDRENIDQARLREAERIALEIESQSTTNIHLAEERNQKLALDFDEEDLYSGVLDKSGKDKAARDDEARKKAAAAAVPKMNYAAAAATRKDGEGAAPAPPTASVEQPKVAVAAAATTPPDLSDLKISSEEKKVDPEAAEEKAKDEIDEDSNKKEKERDEEKPKSKLNANAKAFTFNPGAKSFTPSAPTAAVPPAATMPSSYMSGPHMMGGPQFVPGGPRMPGMMPVPMPMHQQYPGAPYGVMPLPQQGPPLPGQEGGETSSATGEGSEAGQQQQPQQLPQYMPQPGFGGYPGYYPGGAAHPMMHPQPGFHPQMGQQMMQGQVPYQRMFAPGMPPGGMRPPGPYYPGGPPYPGGGYPGGPDDDFYRKNNVAGRGGRGGGGGGGGGKKKNNFDRRQSGGRSAGRGGYQHNDIEGGGGERSGDPSPNNEVEANDVEIKMADGAPAVASENDHSPAEPQSSAQESGS